MWRVSFNEVNYRDGVLIYDGDPLETYMAVNNNGELQIGLQCLTYFAEFGTPYEDIAILYGVLRENANKELERKLWNHFEQPMYLVQDIFIQNRARDKKKRD